MVVSPVSRPLCLQDDKEYVGFATLPNQVHRKSVKKGFDFTLMVAGIGGRGCPSLKADPTLHPKSHGVGGRECGGVPTAPPYPCPSFPGESGLGKSTLINSLFLMDIYKDRKLLNAEGENGNSPRDGVFWVSGGAAEPCASPGGLLPLPLPSGAPPGLQCCL